MVRVEVERRVENVHLIRCPTCDGLRGVHARHLPRQKPVCGDCRNGHVIRREHFYAFWLEQFTPDEIREMADAIDALLGLRIGPR